MADNLRIEPSLRLGAIAKVLPGAILGIALAASALFPDGPVGAIQWGIDHTHIGGSVSVELKGDLPRTGASGEIIVMEWLRSHRALLVAAEQRHHIDRRAIAGVIAWEALKNVRPFWFLMPRSAGPGKVHFRQTWWSGEGDPDSKQAEEFGFEPSRTVQQRRAVLSTDAGAIDYIGAIMEAYVSEGKVDWRCNLGALATLYSGWDIREVVKAPRSQLPEHHFNDMGTWVVRKTAELTSYIGSPRAGLCERDVR